MTTGPTTGPTTDKLVTEYGWQTTKRGVGRRTDGAVPLANGAGSESHGAPPLAVAVHPRHGPG